MEKFEYYLMGRKFISITDHKAIEQMKDKAVFGTHRIQRWFERLNRFDYNVIYREGSKMEQADTMSRCLLISKQGLTEGEIEEKVMEIHVSNAHRKNIKDKIAEIGINLSQNKISKVLKNCKECMQTEKRFGKSARFIVTKRPGEIVACDLMDLKKQKFIVVLIDYFTRKIWAKLIDNKKPEKILVFLEKVREELQFEELLTDNGKEFNNNKVDQWCENNAIKRTFSVPYYHQGNGRVERAIRTIRTGMKKNKGLYQSRLKEVVRTYNEIKHRGIGISPNEAMMSKNREIVLKNQQKYANEFKEKKFEELKTGDDVFIRNESKKDKMDLEFNKQGKVLKKLRENIYLVKEKGGKKRIKHISQLKIWRRDVGENPPIES